MNTSIEKGSNGQSPAQTLEASALSQPELSSSFFLLLTFIL